MSEQPNSSSTTPVLLRFLRRPEVERATGLPRATIYRKMADGEFPKPVPLAGRGVGWVESEIAAWQAQQLAARVA